MEWTDEGIVLAARKHGESAAILQLLTRAHGRHAGLAHGGAGARTRGALQPGNRLQVTWRARLADHLGSYSCEQLHSGAATLLDDPARLAGARAPSGDLRGTHGTRRRPRIERADRRLGPGRRRVGNGSSRRTRL